MKNAKRKNAADDFGQAVGEAAIVHFPKKPDVPLQVRQYRAQLAMLEEHRRNNPVIELDLTQANQPQAEIPRSIQAQAQQNDGRGVKGIFASYKNVFGIV